MSQSISTEARNLPKESRSKVYDQKRSGKNDPKNKKLTYVIPQVGAAMTEVPGELTEAGAIGDALTEVASEATPLSPKRKNTGTDPRKTTASLQGAGPQYLVAFCAKHVFSLQEKSHAPRNIPLR